MPTCIQSVEELRAWARAFLGPNHHPAEAEAIVEYVRRLPDRPEWGADWSAFLHQLSCAQLLDVTQ